MRILLVDIADQLVQAVHAALADGHNITVLDDDPTDATSVRLHGEQDVVVQGIRVSGDDTADIERATLGTWNLLTESTPRLHVQLSNMSVFDGYPPGWAITERWYPRPTPDAGSLVPYLAELAAREICRSRPIDGVALRLATDALTPPNLPQTVAQIVQSIESPPDQRGRWHPRHVHRPGAQLSGGDLADANAPVPHVPADPPSLTGLPVPQRITVFGAGGPLATAMIKAMADRHTLLLTDTRRMAELADAPPQQPGAPTPTPPQPPHREQLVDITDAAAVSDAAVGADCVVNCAVARRDLVSAFRVNVLGALHTMQAAVRLSIPRVVHTGPALVLGPHPFGNLDDWMVGPDTPPHPGDDLYFLTKLLGQEICRVYAEAHRIACPTLLFCAFVAPNVQRRRQPHPFAISWADSGRAMNAAVNVTELPEPFALVHVLAPSPHGRYRAGSAQRILGWQPEDRLDHFWYGRPGTDHVAVFGAE